ncbi:magnesium and cobalt transport protein CorA [Actinacidiphila acidipaludis]|uniref:Magnesium and cobalt transport protein CorA n=1 Tax=Actinacidiphila acidipaludis TaxID=2873382 RepID=A0ABS7QCV8_9ACTN|nr:magnesium and cobalt transport protein CorA [Streptomyces acidipaludis]MBY8880991.1 magnesium and cobalt transport protein CorA [Streptomyces acidipaludis]
MIVDWAVYREGRRMDRPQHFSDALSAARAVDGFVWVGLYEPAREEFDRVSDQFGLHPLAVADALKAHQRPKLEIYDDALFLVLKPLDYAPDTDRVFGQELMIFLGESYVLTVRHGRGSPLTTLRRRLEQNPERLGKGPTAVMYGITDAVVDHYEQVASELHIDLEELESEVFSGTGGRTRDTAPRIYGFKRQIMEFQRAAEPLAQPLNTLTGLGPFGEQVPQVSDEARPFFHNIGEHLARVNESVEGLDRLVSDILSAHLAQISVQQNDDMRKISAWAAMAAVPTLIAGIYGMNFDHMPELHWEVSYPLVIALMAILVAALYRLFKRQGWM